jgi:hypothetical protein
MEEMKTEPVKIEDFIPLEELEAMTPREREIYEETFKLRKAELQTLTDMITFIDNLKTKQA